MRALFADRDSREEFPLNPCLRTARPTTGRTDARKTFLTARASDTSPFRQDSLAPPPPVEDRESSVKQVRFYVFHSRPSSRESSLSWILNADLGDITRRITSGISWDSLERDVCVCVCVCLNVGMSGRVCSGSRTPRVTCTNVSFPARFSITPSLPPCASLRRAALLPAPVYAVRDLFSSLLSFFPSFIIIPLRYHGILFILVPSLRAVVICGGSRMSALEPQAHYRSPLITVFSSGNLVNKFLAR